MLRLEWKRFYKVKEGQSLAQIASAFCVSEFLLAKLNGLVEQPAAGCVLEIPSERGNAYRVRVGDSCELLCGSKENFERKNGAVALYPCMRVIL